MFFVKSQKTRMLTEMWTVYAYGGSDGNKDSTWNWILRPPILYCGKEYGFILSMPETVGGRAQMRWTSLFGKESFMAAQHSGSSFGVGIAGCF